MGATIEEEMVSAMNLLVDAYEDLKKISPQHELLRFVKEITIDKVKFTDEEALSNEFLERFPSVNPNSDYEHRIYSFIAYERALREAKPVEYFREKGLAIEVCGGMKGNALVIDFKVGELDFTESLIATGVASFAVIPKEQFKRLEKSGVVIDVVDKKLIDPYTGHSVPAKVGRADIEIRGRIGSRKYQGVSIVGVDFHVDYKWGSILGREFISSFNETEMGWPGDPVVGFYGCKKIKP